MGKFETSTQRHPGCGPLSAPSAAEVGIDPGSARKSFFLVFCCTVVGAVAQLLIKKGAGQLGVHIGLPQVLHDPMFVFRFGFRILENLRLFVGYLLYGVNTVLMAYALKGRELSRLYPIIALTYVWVTALSVMMLHENINGFRLFGIALIVGGVSILGGSKVAKT